MHRTGCSMVAVALLGMLVTASALSLPDRGPERIPNADLYVAADNLANVFFNGQLLGKTYRWWEQIKYSISVKPGDWIVIVARDRGSLYGVMAALISTKKPCVTKVGSGPWRAIKRGKVAGQNFKVQRYDASAWPLPTAATAVVPGPGTVRAFSYETTGTEYVWAEDAGENNSIVLRLNVTDECVDPLT